MMNNFFKLTQDDILNSVVLYHDKDYGCLIREDNGYKVWAMNIGGKTRVIIERGEYGNQQKVNEYYL